MFEDKVLERDDFALDQAEGLQSAPASLRETTPHQSPAAWQPPSPSEPDEEQLRAAGKQRRNGLLHRAACLSHRCDVLAAALGGGYVYLDYAKHFQSTDDAFIAARQTALAPKVSGYLTAVPVTDNEHVAAGDVIARIDDRDYRIALEQAEAQVAAAQASIDNIDAQLQVQQAQISANEAQVDQAQAALVFAQQQAARYQHLAQTGYGTVQNDQQWNSQQHQQEAALRSAQATLKLSQRQIEALKAQRNSARRKPRPSPGAARPGAAESVLHDGDGGPAGTRRQSQRRRRSIRSTGHEPDHVRAGSNLGHGELQGDSARPHAAPDSR